MAAVKFAFCILAEHDSSGVVPQTLWTLEAYVLIPVAVVLLLVLQLCPLSLQRYLLKGIRGLLWSRLGFLPMPLLHCLFSVLTLVLGVSSFESYRITSKPVSDVLEGITERHRAKVWRAQRNLYLTALTFVLWWMVFSVYRYDMQLQLLRDRLDVAQADSRKTPIDKKND
ncbi:MAG: hypothetical protein MHM6MM_000249 [Cercozoa sp. M6MM]